MYVCEGGRGDGQIGRWEEVIVGEGGGGREGCECVEGGVCVCM